MNIFRWVTPGFKKVYDFILDIPKIPWFKPKKRSSLADEAAVRKLVKRHLRIMSRYSYENLSKIGVRFVKSREPPHVVSDFGRNVNYATGYNYAALHFQDGAAESDETHAIYRQGFRDAYSAVSGTPDKETHLAYDAGQVFGLAAVDVRLGAYTKESFWFPLVEIYRLGYVPMLEIVNKEFLVWVPQQQ